MLPLAPTSTRHMPSRQRSFLVTRPSCLDMADPDELVRLHTAGPATSVLTLLMSPALETAASGQYTRPTGPLVTVTARRTRLPGSLRNAQRKITARTDARRAMMGQ
jgi:hypothetical protein